MDIDLSTDTAPYPGRTLQLAETLAEIVRTLNHQTRHHEALQYPSEADRLIRELSLAVSRLPQLCGQVGAWLDTEYEAGRIKMTGGKYAGDPSLAVLAAVSWLESASEYAAMLGQALDRAASVTSDMTVAEPPAGPKEAGVEH